MLRRSVLESSLSAQHTSIMPQCGHKPTSNYSWPHRVGVVILGVLSLAWTIQGVAATDLAGFTQHCSGLAQDPLLGALWPGTPAPGMEKRSAVLTAMVPRLFLRGMALATYEPRKMAPTAPTLEAVFGLVPGTQREITETPFAQDARSVVLYPNVLATVAHAITPDVVEVQVAQQPSVQTVPLRVTSMTVVARRAPGEDGVPAQVAHVNTPYDLALVQADQNRLLQPLPYAAVLSYGTGDPEKPSGGLQAGDCVALRLPTRQALAGAEVGPARSDAAIATVCRTGMVNLLTILPSVPWSLGLLQRRHPRRPDRVSRRCPGGGDARRSWAPSASMLS